ncbi:MAG TPA: sigma-70 family RNA polymerase sigma factor [Candidatus Omnitrophota bacterium]|nr:sigma-70 family RNA polymerase sigma factor [Candidatus Omnitrophota bacterium]
MENYKAVSNEDYGIILEVLGGRQNEYAEIVRKYEGRVRGYCLTLLSDPAQAEDAAQEIFIKAYQRLDQYRAESAFSTWLYRITANHCLDLLRKRSRHKTESWDALLEKEGEKAETLLGAAPDDEDKLEQKDMIQKLLACLPEKSRTILVLREIHGLSYQELAETLECSLDAVKARLKRARHELQKNADTFPARESSKESEAHHEA